MNQSESPFKNSDGSDQTCIQMLHHVLDGAATPEQHNYFKNHMEACMPCYKSHEIDVAIRDLIKMKCQGNNIPEDLLDRIKSGVSQRD